MRLRKVRLVRRDCPRCFGFLEVIQSLFRGAAFRLAQVSGPGKRHVKDLGRRQVLRVRLVQIVVALGVLRYAVVRADAGRDLSRSNASYLEATFLFHLSSARRKRLCLQRSLREEVQALWRRRLRSLRGRCCRRRRLEQRRRRKILRRWSSTTDDGTCCTERRGAAATAAPSREHRRVRHLPSTNVCGGRGSGLRRLVHCAGYRGAEEASAISFCTVIFVRRSQRGEQDLKLRPTRFLLLLLGRRRRLLLPSRASFGKGG